MLKVLISTVLVATSLSKSHSKEDHSCEVKPDCGDGFKLNKETCECAAITTCDKSCDSGFKQDRESCECTSILTLPKKCPKGKAQPKCPEYYAALTDGTCGCKLAVDVCEFQLKCPYG